MLVILPTNLSVWCQRSMSVKVIPLDPLFGTALKSEYNQNITLAIQ